QECLVLLMILRNAAAQMLTVGSGIGRVPGNGVELVIPHHGLGCPGIEHFADDSDRLQLPRPAIDEVANEDRSPLRMTPGSQAVPVAHLTEQRGQLVRVTVDVADYVVAHIALLVVVCHYLT